MAVGDGVSNFRRGGRHSGARLAFRGYSPRVMATAAAPRTPGPVSHSPNGRPVARLSAPLIEALAFLIRGGVPLATASRELGVPYRSLQTWLARGRAPDDGCPALRPNQQLYTDLYQAAESARRERQQTVDRLLDRARQHAAMRRGS